MASDFTKKYRGQVSMLLPIMSVAIKIDEVIDFKTVKDSHAKSFMSVYFK